MGFAQCLLHIKKARVLVLAQIMRIILLIAIISTGFNIYGHPDKETLDTLKNNGVKVFRTDKNGAVKLVLDKDKISVYSYNGRNKKFERTGND